ncbi:MAG: hypothetical protein NTV79_09290, partial [Candidatus Aureabacteria bacterium]|nr:hypothetical protein [Candidatus Auribacterota bacterium]
MPTIKKTVVSIFPYFDISIFILVLAVVAVNPVRAAGPTPAPSPAETAGDPFRAAVLHVVAQAGRA